jgi:hypothetical protein
MNERRFPPPWSVEDIGAAFGAVSFCGKRSPKAKSIRNAFTDRYSAS